MNHGVLVNMTVIEWTHHWGASVVRNDWVGIWVTTCLYTPTPLGWFYGVELNWIDSRGVKGDTLAPGEAGNKIRSAQVDGWGVKRVPLRPRWSNCPLIENNGRLIYSSTGLSFFMGVWLVFIVPETLGRFFSLGACDHSFVMHVAIVALQWPKWFWGKCCHPDQCPYVIERSVAKARPPGVKGYWPWHNKRVYYTACMCWRIQNIIDTCMVCDKYIQHDHL